jgi:DNA polymerase III alpha subunit
MDFLGLRNLTVIKDCLKIIKEAHGAFEVDHRAS